MIVGSKLQVWNGTAKHTSGGLTKAHLMLNKRGKVVSKKQHEAGLKVGAKNLDGYLHKPKGARKALPRRVKNLKGGGAYSSNGGRVRRGGGLEDLIPLGVSAVSAVKDLFTGAPDPDKQQQRDWALREYNRVHGTQFGVEGKHWNVAIGQGLHRKRRTRAKKM